jgi:hypothetical protein
MKKIALLILFVLVFGVTVTVALPPATVEDIEMSPTNPVPLDTVIFTVSFDYGERPLDARLLIKECNGNTGLCYTPENKTVLNTSAVFTLTHEDATYISYWVSLHELNGTWTNTPAVKVDLTIDGNDDGGNGSIDILLLSVGIIMGVICIVAGYFGFRTYMRRREK